MILPIVLIFEVGSLPSLLFPGQFRKTVKDPAVEFTEYTKLQWPGSAVVVTVGDDHGGWHGDGEFRLVFDADKDTLVRWLAQKPPWGDAEWKSGPVPDDIAGHCFVALSNGPDHRQGLADSHVRYCAHDFKLSNIPWHNGKLLAIDPNAGRVYLSWWDF
ncbi:MAG TPA: hypothetical protein VMR25_15800 [Planctomycetaceae bacterium]|nr:hypothetical protein [Planctomycetaceae bacterium]